MYVFQEPNDQQLELFERSLPFSGTLDRDNRWIVLAHAINWRELEGSYAKLFAESGRPALRARYVLGTLIIKHHFELSDEDIVQLITENPYLQYFIGLPQFTTRAPFDVSSLSRVRERLGEKTFREFEQTLIATLVAKKLLKPRSLQVDATVFESEITYPTDCGLLEKARRFCVKQIQQLRHVVKKKVRTYSRVAKKHYLNFTKKKHKTKKQIRRMQKSLLQYVRRNLRQLSELITQAEALGYTVADRIIKTLETARRIYAQQCEMYKEQKKSIANRIVSLTKPYVRPIVRGKNGKDVEFGAKVQLSYVGGYLFVDHLSFDNFNESTRLKDSLEAYQRRFGNLPNEVLMDQIFGTHDNRTYLREQGIRSSVKKLGRPAQSEASACERRWRRRKQRERNRIEGAIGNGKTCHDLGVVRAKTPKTEESWIQMALFSRNLMLAAKKI